MVAAVMTVFMRVLRALGLDRVFFSMMYLMGRAPWDTGITPPEVVAAIEGANKLTPGRALDIGCGTGTNTLYLARHGWEVTGVDFAAPAIAEARRKLKREPGLTTKVKFVQGDATRLDSLPINGPCSFVLDMGCFHGIPVNARQAYVRGVAHRAAPGALYMLYAFGPRQLGGRRAGVTPDDVRALFGADFSVERVQEGSDRGGMASAWYWMRRRA